MVSVPPKRNCESVDDVTTEGPLRSGLRRGWKCTFSTQRGEIVSRKDLLSVNETIPNPPRVTILPLKVRKKVVS